MAGTGEPSPTRRGRYLGLTAVVVAAALWGLGGTVASRLFSQGVLPLELVETRTYLTLAGLVVLLAATQRGRPRGPVSWPLIVALGLAIAIANACLFLSIQHLPVAVAMVLQNLAPAFVLGGHLVATRRRPDPRVVLGLLVALAGVALVVELPTTPLGELDLAGIGFGLATAAGVAAFSVLGSTATQRYGAIRANTYAFGVASVMWLLFQLPQGLPAILREREHLAAVLFVGVLGTLAPFVLFAWGTARVGPQAGAVNISLEPAFSAALAWVWLGQALTATQLLGGAVLVGAVVWLQRSPRAERTSGSEAGVHPAGTAAPSTDR